MERALKGQRRLGRGIAGLAVAAGVAFAALRLRRWQLNWGATEEEQRLPLPGDDIVAKPDHVTTRAITIHASPEDVWPWLVQMGKGRGGLYSYDSLDIAFKVLDKPSEERILPEFQCLKPGDVMPIGRDDTTQDDFYVHVVEPNRALVIGANDLAFRDRVSWAMVLVPTGDSTRLLVRVRFRSEPTAAGLLTRAIMEPTSFIMLRKQMLTFKRLAERTHAERLALPS